MAAKSQKPPRAESRPSPEPGRPGFTFRRPVLWAAGLFTFIACLLTFPLVFRLNSSIYGFYDHISTDLFASIHYYFWWMQYSLVSLKSSPILTPLFAAPFGSRMFFANFTGFLMTPVSALFGFLISYNVVILANLVLSALGMFLLVRHLTGRAAAGIIAGIAYGFCTNLLVRSYTTFDSTQVQWIPFYTLFVIRFLEERTWKNALLAGLFLLCNILLAMPYYLVYLPLHTIILLAVYALWRICRDKRGAAGFLRGLVSREALGAWMKIGLTFATVVVAFLAYYFVVVGGSPTYAGAKPWEITELAGLSLQPADYFVPHPRSALLKGDFKTTYWDVVPRPEKNADSNTAYMGYLALALAVLGVAKWRGGPEKWFFLAGAFVAFWATLGPVVLGLPSPSWLIHQYAPFARRILLYKTYVQFGVAGLAGLGAAVLLSNVRSRTMATLFTGLIVTGMLLEYTVTPPFLSVNLTDTPEVYERVRALPADSKIIEAPLRRANGNLYQGYVYYQTFHHKPLFNPYMGLNRVPEHIQPFYNQMVTPLEAASFSNLAALRQLGISHLVYHLYIGTQTVRFLSLAAPPLMADSMSVEGLNRIYTGPRSIAPAYESPYDYTFADLYEITAPPSPAALVFDYHSPFERFGGAGGQDGMIDYGWYSALLDPETTFYYPLFREGRMERVMKGAGKVTAINLTNDPQTIGIQFTASAPDARTLDIRWNDNPVGTVTLGPEPVTLNVGNLALDASGTGALTLTPSGAPFQYTLMVGQNSLPLPATAVFTDFRVVK